MGLSIDQLRDGVYEVEELNKREKELIGKKNQLDSDDLSDMELLEKINLELTTINNKRAVLSKEISNEFKRRKKEDRSGTTLLISLIAFVVMLIITIVKWISSGAFPTVFVCITAAILIPIAISIYFFNKYSQ